MRLFQTRTFVALASVLVVTACSAISTPSSVPSGSTDARSAPAGAGMRADTSGTSKAGSSYNAAVLALDPNLYYETNETSGTVALDASGHERNGQYVALVALAAPGCCGNRGISIKSGSTVVGLTNPELESPVAGSDPMFDPPFTVGLSIDPKAPSYPGYGTYWYAGTARTENGFGYGWDFNYGNDNLAQVAGYNVNWGYAGHASLLYRHALITGNHQWVVSVTSSTISLYLDGTQVATTSYSAPFQIRAGGQNLSFGDTEIGPASFDCDCTLSSIFFVPRALSSSQIASLQTAALSSSGGSTPSPTPAPTHTPTPTPSHTPAPSPAPTPKPTASATPGTAAAISYNSVSACINHQLFTNNVLPPNVGEFETSGFDRLFWGGLKGREEPPAAAWGPGYFMSWGRHQYDTNMGDPSQGFGFPDPFAVVQDEGLQALQIAAYPVPSPIATSLDLMQNDQYIVANAKSSYAVPEEGGSLTVDVDNPNGAQNGFKVGVGFRGAATTFIGTLTSGGATPSGNGTGGSNPWTISNIHVYAGVPKTVLNPASNPNNYALRSYAFPKYYSGALDTNVNQEYGFFVARLRLPQPAAGLSPAFWMLETGGVGQNQGKLMRSEWDIEEQFGSDYNYNLNAGNILWNSGDNGKWYSYGCGTSCGPNGATANGATGVYPWPSSGNYNSEYHDYGVLISRGGPAFPTNYSGSQGGVYTAGNSPYVGTTFFVDGVPVAGHEGAPDLTQGSPDKEIMLMFQVAAPGTFLDPYNEAKNDKWPQYLYARWLRAYRPSTSSC